MHAQQTTTGFYLLPEGMTAPGRYQPLLAGLPHGVAAVADLLHGLVIHEHIATAYGVTLTDQRRASVHIRPAVRLLDGITVEDGGPLTVARPPESRLAGNCRHFTVLAAAALRAQGTPARARCGFGGYFGTGAWEDHWVCEYWNSAEGRWVLADAQIDDVQRGMFEIDFDLMDVPRDRFLVAGDAWRRCRAGDADPAAFGLSLLKESGDWWIAANLIRDVAALNNMEMLPWDVWGAMPKPGEAIDGERLALFDRLAALTKVPDSAFEELTSVYASDDQVRVPQTVFNAVLLRTEDL